MHSAIMYLLYEENKTVLGKTYRYAGVSCFCDGGLQGTVKINIILNSKEISSKYIVYHSYYQ